MGGDASVQAVLNPDDAFGVVMSGLIRGAVFIKQPEQFTVRDGVYHFSEPCEFFRAEGVLPVFLNQIFEAAVVMIHSAVKQLK